MCSDTNVIVADFRYDIQHATPNGVVRNIVGTAPSYR